MPVPPSVVTAPTFTISPRCYRLAGGVNHLYSDRESSSSIFVVPDTDIHDARNG